MTTMVLLHGMLQLPVSFRPLLAARPAEVRDWAVSAPRLPGHGVDPFGLEHETFEDAVTALAARLPRSIDRLCGYSLGARLALGLLRVRPDIGEVLAIGPQLGLLDLGERAARCAWEDEMAARVTRDGVPSFAQHWEGLPVFEGQGRLPAEVQAAQREVRRAHEARGLSWAFRVLGSGRMPPLHDLVARHAARVTLITGARDRKFAAIADGAAARFGVRHVEIPEAGHNVPLEAPTALWRAILERSSRRSAHESAHDPQLSRTQPLTPARAENQSRGTS